MKRKKTNSFLFLLFYLGPNRKMALTQNTEGSLKESLDWNVHPSFPHPFKYPLEDSSLPGFPRGSGNLNTHCPYLLVALCFGTWETAAATPSQKGNNVFHIQAWGRWDGGGALGRLLTHCGPSSKDSKAWREEWWEGTVFRCAKLGQQQPPDVSGVTVKAGGTF